jgi:aspartate aminotransferase-like enzyme/GNAT superfamily N-acetyltransferase
MSELFKYKIADQQWEFEEIKRLNYEIFVEEIPQHQRRQDRSLTDKFHDENIYFICISEKNLIGMVAIRNKRPFSIDQKLENIDAYLPQAKSICEVRLLAVKPQFRRSRISFNLLIYVAQFCQQQGYDLVVISAVLNQRKLYEHMGFKAFGPLVGTPQVRFQPMYMTLKDYQKNVEPLLEIEKKNDNVINFLPGPVEISDEVKQAFNKTISHRSEKFLTLHDDTKCRLCKLANAKNVEIFMGGGTLANDVIAGQLSLLGEKGLILSNGEFGERIINQAQRFGLDFETISLEWGQEFDWRIIDKTLQQNKIKWLWAVHCETSTGILNDINTLKNICGKYNVKLCLDCISSLGTAILDLSDVYLASGISGKALGSFSGLAFVFYNHNLSPSQNKLPASLDLAHYSKKSGVPFTISSNLVSALNMAVKKIDLPKRFKNISEISAMLKSELRKLGANIIVPDNLADRAVITICLPEEINSEDAGRQLEQKGIWISYHSEYLLKRNWIQICLMSEYSEKQIQTLVDALREILIPLPQIDVAKNAETKKSQSLKFLKLLFIVWSLIFCCCNCLADTLKIKQCENGTISIIDKKKNSEPNLIIDPAIKTPSDCNKLVIVTHGWVDRGKGRLSEYIADAIKERTDSNEWLCGYFEWPDGAMTISCIDCARYARDTAGPQLAKAIMALGTFEHIHLIGHSSGCWAIDGAAKILQEKTNSQIHLTFLDAYVPNDWDQSQLGNLNNAKTNWVEHYYTKDITMNVTQVDLSNAFNVDITQADPGLTEHKFPLRWYYATITGQYHKTDYRSGSKIIYECNGVDYGFSRSLESGNENFQKSLELKENRKVIKINNTSK